MIKLRRHVSLARKAAEYIPLKPQRGSLIVMLASMGDLLLASGAIKHIAAHSAGGTCVVINDYAAPVIDILDLPNVHWVKLGTNSMHNLFRLIPVFRCRWKRVIHAVYSTNDHSHEICMAAQSECKVWFNGNRSDKGEPLLSDPTQVYTRIVEVDRNAHELDKLRSMLDALGGAGGACVYPVLDPSIAECRFQVSGLRSQGCRSDAPQREKRSPFRLHQITARQGRGWGVATTKYTKVTKWVRGLGALHRSSRRDPPGGAGLAQSGGHREDRTQRGKEKGISHYEKREIHEMGCGNERIAKIVICPGGRFPQKKWANSNFAKLIELLAARMPEAEFCLLGGVGDTDACDEIENICLDERVKNLCGQFSVKQTVKEIAESSLCIGNDSFALHAAIAVGTPSVVIMGGGDYPRWVPWKDVQFHRMVCMVCEYEGCGWECRFEGEKKYNCISEITVEDVMREVDAEKKV